MKLLGESGDKTVLSPGIHSFPFRLGLPLGLPSTFLGCYGWIQYFCKAALQEPAGLVHKNYQVFIIMNPIDLNMEENYVSVRIGIILIICDCENRKKQKKTKTNTKAKLTANPK